MEASQILTVAYRERSHLLAYLAAVHPSVIAPSHDVAEPGWQLLYVYIAGQQLTWHISPQDADLFEHVEAVTVEDYRAQWDGHTTEQKYAWLREHTTSTVAPARLHLWSELPL